MSAALCILLVGFAHLVRDGWPATGSTQLARFLGGALCFAGALAVHSWQVAAVMAGTVWLGFYLDMKHGDGQGADNWASAGYLALSGVTSLFPLALVTHWWLAMFGIVKVPIWFGCWHVPQRFIYPTRVAAVSFGVVVGIMINLNELAPWISRTLRITGMP